MTAYTHKLMTEGEETKQTYLCFGIALTKLACSNRSHWDVSSGSLGAETGVCEEVWLTIIVIHDLVNVINLQSCKISLIEYDFNIFR